MADVILDFDDAIQYYMAEKIGVLSSVVGQSVVVTKYEDEGEESWECTGRWSYGCREDNCEHMDFVKEHIAQTIEGVGEAPYQVFA